MEKLNYVGPTIQSELIELEEGIATGSVSVTNFSSSQQLQSEWEEDEVNRTFNHTTESWTITP